MIQLITIFIVFVYGVWVGRATKVWEEEWEEKANLVKEDL